MTIYVSGPMSLIPDMNKAAFNEAAAELRQQGHTVLVPHEITAVAANSANDACSWDQAMRADLIAMLRADCDTIAMLPGWEHSRGARLEHHVAKKLGYDIYSYAHGELK